MNKTNSSAPDTERAVVAKASYGRQLGRITDAIEELIKERPDTLGTKEAFTELARLVEQIDEAKRDAAIARIERLRADLATLRDTDPEEFAKQRGAIVEILKI